MGSWLTSRQARQQCTIHQPVLLTGLAGPADPRGDTTPRVCAKQRDVGTGEILEPQFKKGCNTPQTSNRRASQPAGWGVLVSRTVRAPTSITPALWQLEDSEQFTG